MKQLISVLTRQVLKQVEPEKSNIVRIESFDNPLIYMGVCQNIMNSHEVDCCIPKLAREKYIEFENLHNSEWEQALNYLHQGLNLHYSNIVDDSYSRKSYVDFNNAITKWRNESANLDPEKTALILLMGTESAPDTGGLVDTSYVISLKEVLDELKLNYSSWFSSVLLENGIASVEINTALHTLYHVIFSAVNIDLMKLSLFIDGLHNLQFSSAQELISHICETLNKTWGIPSVIQEKSVPRIQNLCKGKVSSAKIISDAIKFIERDDDIPSNSEVDKLHMKFEKYAIDTGLDITSPFPEDTKLFRNYTLFKNCVIDFMSRKDINENRSILLKVDYAVIDKIVGTKLPSRRVEKTSIITGEPVEAYTRIFMETIWSFYNIYSSYPTNIIMRVEGVSLPNFIDKEREDISSEGANDRKEETYMQLCNFLGGILGFFNDTGLGCDGKLLVFSYASSSLSTFDPFDFSNYDEIKNRVKGTGKWGDPCKIHFLIKASNDENSHNYDFRWVFSPYSAWMNAFSYLSDVLYRGDSYTLPTMVVCQNMQDFLCCESGEEFYGQLNQIRDVVLYEEHKREISRYFSGNRVSGLFDLVCNNFKDFAVQLVQHGYFTALGQLHKVVKSFSDLLEYINDNLETFTEVQIEKVPLLINSFCLTSNKDIIKNCDFGEVILPAYNPVLLEKIDAKQLFIRAGFVEMITLKMERKCTDKKIDAKFSNLIELSSITQGADVIYRKGNTYLTCKDMWEYFGVYYDLSNDNNRLISGNSFGSSIVTDDEDAPYILSTTPMSNIIVRNVLDYIRTFPARTDGLNVAFIAPADMQHIVAAIHAIAKNLDNNNTPATINIKLICLNNKKNSATYMRRWLDSYFSDERIVKVNTFLRNITIRDQSDIENLDTLICNYDLCFVYDVLQAREVQFLPSGDEVVDKNQEKFPMTFTPDTIPATHGKSRKVSISQFQFISSKWHTQANHIIGNSNSVRGVLYRAFKTLEFTDIYEQIIEASHRSCKWVVCIDPAIDRNMLEASNQSKIIGFTTGEGSCGELNVTVSARKDILKDIKKMLCQRITEKFPNWDDVRLRKATDYCVDVLSQYIDGSRILKALNPYDYEIHSFLAYLLTLQMLGLPTDDGTYVSRTLVSLDSHKHWFAEDDDINKDSKRPDFMLIEIPKTTENLSPDGKLHIEVKVIECKMGFKSDAHITKAITQLEKGIQTLSANWNPDNEGVMRRYWLNQLYRAIIFSPIRMDNTTEEYNILRNKIYGILDGNYEITWSGDVFAFWLDSNSEIPDEWPIGSPIIDNLLEEGTKVKSLICHNCGQMFIQKMLLPPEERQVVLEYNELDSANNQGDIDISDLEYDDDNTESIGNGITIPKTKDIYIPFIHHLNDDSEHTRQSCLEWYQNYFSISKEDKKLIYPSNGHLKWETALDFTITDFRKYDLLANSRLGAFNITPFGRKIAEELDKKLPDEKFLDFVIRQQASGENNVLYGGGQVETQTNLSNHIANDMVEISTDLLDDDSEEVSRKSLIDVRFLIGEDLRTREKYYWEFGNKELNNRHLLINGNSGCGKTYCIQTLLMEAALQGISSVVFDYTGGFTSSKLDPLFKETLGDRIQQRVIRLSKIPVNPFEKHDIQIDEDLFVPEDDVDVASKIAEIFSTVYSLGDQQKSAIYSAVLQGIKSHGQSMNFAYMNEELEKQGTSYAKTVISKIQTFTDINPFAVDEEFSWSDIRDSDGIVYIIQLTGYGRDIQILLTELLLWDIWSFSVKKGDENTPFVLVLDEAQNLSHGDRSPSAKILTEGRKFGLSGWYATQFMKPQLSDDEIQRLQQAGQKLYFCPPDDGIMTVAKNIDITTQGAKEWSERLKKLKKGECVTCGNMIRNGKWSKYEPRTIKVTSLQERINNEH